MHKDQDLDTAVAKWNSVLINLLFTPMLSLLEHVEMSSAEKTLFEIKPAQCRLGFGAFLLGVTKL